MTVVQASLPHLVELPQLSNVELRWVPGSGHQVAFEKGGRQFTVRLRDIERPDMHTFDALYLRGRVTVLVSARHLAQLMGALRQAVTPEVVGTLPGSWVRAGGLVEDEPGDGRASLSSVTDPRVDSGDGSSALSARGTEEL